MMETTRVGRERTAEWLATRKIEGNTTPYEFLGSIPKETREWRVDEILEALGRPDATIHAWRHGGKKINLYQEARNGRAGSVPREVYVFDLSPFLIRVRATLSDYYAMCEVSYLPE